MLYRIEVVPTSVGRWLSNLTPDSCCTAKIRIYYPNHLLPKSDVRCYRRPVDVRRPSDQTSDAFILQTTYPRSSVTLTLAGPSGRRPPGTVASPKGGGGGKRGSLPPPTSDRTAPTSDWRSMQIPGDFHVGKNEGRFTGFAPTF